MKYLYEIAGVKVGCDIPFPVKMKRESAAFFSELRENVTTDYEMMIQPVRELPSLEDGGHWEVCRYYIEKNGLLYTNFCAEPRGFVYARSHREGKKIICEYVEENESYINYSTNICDIMEVERLLLDIHAILLHCSYISYRGKALLFSAPSGTGKSTQADLWKKYKDADIINGDRAGVRRLGSKAWDAYGLPYAGSSNIFRNDKTELGAIIILRQAKENVIKRLSPAQAIRYLYPETMVHYWEKSYVDEIMDLLVQLTTEIPVYMLACRPDREAVEVAFRMLEDDRIWPI